MATFFRNLVGQTRGRQSSASFSSSVIIGGNQHRGSGIVGRSSTKSDSAIGKSGTTRTSVTSSTTTPKTSSPSKAGARTGEDPQSGKNKTLPLPSINSARGLFSPSSAFSLISSAFTGAAALFKRPVVTMASGDYSDKVKKTKDEWREILKYEEYKVLREAGTEPPRSGEYDKHYPKKGYYKCRGCGLPLYSFAAKFNSGCGWPAYDKCYHSKEWGAHCMFKEDHSHGMTRTEILCKRCDGHLGHVFYGEQGAGSERHCVNSVSVKYVDGEEPPDVQSGPLKAKISFKDVVQPESAPDNPANL